MSSTDPSGSLSPGCPRLEMANRLVYWDDLPSKERLELEIHAINCPSCGPRLALLQRAQDVLESSIRLTRQGEEPHPSSEELYDFAEAPGAGSLDAARRGLITKHVRRCPSCRKLVRSLVIPPPIPLPPQAKLHESTARTGPRPLPRTLLAAAAAVLLVGFLWKAMAVRTESPLLHSSVNEAVLPFHVFPKPPDVLRTSGHVDPLLFPRGRVLAGGLDEGSPVGLAHSLLFEILIREDAETYRVHLFGESEDAFSEGERIATLVSGGPEIELPESLSAAFAPGNYTWEAWAIVDGLDQYLGRRGFEVVYDPDTLESLARFQARSEPVRSNTSVLLLDAGDYYTDARALVRQLPPGTAREEYLALKLQR